MGIRALRQDPASGTTNTRPGANGTDGRKSPLIANLLLSVGGLLAALFLVEIAVRLVVPASAAVTWSHRPHDFYLPEGTLDNRDFAYTEAKHPDSFRIAVVGDSFSFSGKNQFYDAFSKRLETMLNLNRTVKHAEVMNWGVPGESTRMEVPRVRDAFDRFNSDLVILQITLNDPEQKPFRARHSYQDAEGNVKADTGIFRIWKTLGLIRSRLRNIQLQNEYREYYHDLFEDRGIWNGFSGAVDAIAESAHNRNKPVFAVVFPLFSQVIDDHYPFAPYHAKIREKLTSVGLPFVDLLPQYVGIPAEMLQVKPGSDSHPNEIANRIAADAIYSELLNQNLIPEELRARRVVKKRHVPSHAKGLGGEAKITGMMSGVAEP